MSLERNLHNLKIRLLFAVFLSFNKSKLLKKVLLNQDKILHIDEKVAIIIKIAEVIVFLVCKTL